MFGGLKNSRTFASLSKGSTSENRGFGEVAEWSIAAVLKSSICEIYTLFTPKNVNWVFLYFLRFFKRMSITKRLVFLWTGRMNLYDEKYSYSKK